MAEERRTRGGQSTALVERLEGAQMAQRTGQPVENVLDLIRKMRDQFQVALPRQLDADRFVRVAITTLRTNPKLLTCDRDSLLAGLMVSAQLGLEPGGPLGHAYFVPYGRELTFIVGYRGYIDLARRSGLISDVYAEAVREGDDFSWALGLHRDILHVPGKGERGDITHVYAVATYKDGMSPTFVVLDRAKIEAYRKRSKAANNGPWVTDYEAMALKTSVRRLATWLPLSVELARAVAADESIITPSTRLESFDGAPVIEDLERAAEQAQTEAEAVELKPRSDSGEQETLVSD